MRSGPPPQAWYPDFEIQKGKMIIKVCNRGLRNGANSAGVTLLLQSGAGCF